MSKKDINIKRTLLNAINEIKSDLHGLSLSDIINQFTTDINEYDKDTIERENKVILDFTDVYLLGIEDNNVFGKEVELIHIKTLKVESYTTNWERTYILTGRRIVFHKGGFYSREFDTSVYSMFTEKKLRGLTKITKEEYESHYKTYKTLCDIISEILHD
jgi:hypothetical protein